MQTILGWTDAQTSSYASSTEASRQSTGTMIVAVGVSWALIPLFAPPNGNYAPPELEREKLFLNIWNEKQVFEP